MQKIEELFDGILDTCKTDTVDLELKNLNQYVCDHIQYQSYTKKCLRKMCKVRFYWDYLKIQTTQNSETHLFEHPKPRTNVVRFLSYFITLNNQLKR